MCAAAWGVTPSLTLRLEYELDVERLFAPNAYFCAQNAVLRLAIVIGLGTLGWGLGIALGLGLGRDRGSGRGGVLDLAEWDAAAGSAQCTVVSGVGRSRDGPGRSGLFPVYGYRWLCKTACT
eukprot:5082609-Prymnesium_polylepis.3